MPARKISAKVIPGREITEKACCLREFGVRRRAPKDPVFGICHLLKKVDENFIL